MSESINSKPEDRISTEQRTRCALKLTLATTLCCYASLMRQIQCIYDRLGKSSLAEQIYTSLVVCDARGGTGGGLLLFCVPLGAIPGIETVRPQKGLYALHTQETLVATILHTAAIRRPVRNAPTPERPREEHAFCAHRHAPDTQAAR